MKDDRLTDDNINIGSNKNLYSFWLTRQTDDSLKNYETFLRRYHKLTVTTEKKTESQTTVRQSKRHINVVNDCEYTDINYSLSNVIVDSLTTDRHYIKDVKKRQLSATEECQFYGIKLTNVNTYVNEDGKTVKFKKTLKFMKLKSQQTFSHIKSSRYPESSLERKTINKLMKDYYKKEYLKTKNTMYLFLSFNPEITERRLSEIRKYNYDIINYFTMADNIGRQNNIPPFNFSQSEILSEIKNMKSDIDDCIENEVKTINKILSNISRNIKKFYGNINVS